MTLTYNQAKKLGKLKSLLAAGKVKLSRKKKIQLARLASGWKRPKRPKKISAQQKLRRKERKKAKAKIKRDAREIMMMEHLVKNDWQRSGPAMDVWIHGAWGGIDSKDCYATLCHAYKIQMKLDSTGYERPATMDDDLMENL